MRKVVALLSIVLVVGLTPSAFAATNPKTVTVAFTKVLTATENSLEALELKYEEGVDALDLELSDSTIQANQTYDQELRAASNLYSPQITASNQKMSDARSKFSSVSSIRVLSLGTNRNYWGNINCPTTRPDCKDVDKGNKFNVGEISTIKSELSTTSLEYLPEIDIMVSLGLIELISPTEYSTVSSTLRNEPTNLKKITSQFESAQSSAQRKKNQAIEKATAQRAALLDDLNETYYEEKEQLEAQQKAAELALLASKRAAKDASNFDSAFVVAYKFEYNRQMINEIADASWTGEWTYRTIDSILKVNRLAVTGDNIASRYTRSAANAFNSTVGNAFTNEPEFRAALKVLTATYKQATKSTLRF